MIGRAVAGLAALALAGCVNAPASAPTVDPKAECQVTQVVDGDTLSLSCGGKPATLVRLSGIDAPEIEQANCPAERQKGEVAKRKLEALASSGQITGLSFGERLGDGRRLTRLEIAGQDAGTAMMEAGFARPFDGTSYTDWCART